MVNESSSGCEWKIRETAAYKSNIIGELRKTNMAAAAEAIASS